MKYKAIFLDLDGTLLDPWGKITKTAKDSIIAAQKRGVTVVINSGRTPGDIERILQRYGLNLPYIALNGAYIHDTLSDKTIDKNVIDEQLCKKILRLGKRVQNNIIWYSRDRAYLYKITGEKTSKNKLQDLVESIMVVSRRFILLEQLKHKIHSGELEFYKCAILCTNLKKLRAIRKEIDDQGLLESALTSPVFLELNARGISKGIAMAKLLAYYGISMEAAIAVGDNENDLSMLKAAGLGVAMGNAVPKVKLMADAITETNRNNGVAKVIHQYFLRK